MAQVQTQAPQAGTLYLSDFFEQPNPDVISHGETVARSAAQWRQQGAVVRHEVVENPLTKKAHRFDVYLDQRQFSPEEMKQFLADYTDQCQVGQMQTATADLKMWLDQGVHHSAINLSRGCGQAQVAEAVYQRVSPAFGFDPVAQVKARQRLAKMAPALGTSLEQLLSQDRQVAQKARLQFQQNLVDLIDQTSRGSQLLAQAQAEYDSLVDRLAEQKVSVIVAAANSGKVLEDMALDAGGQRIQVSPNFWNNRLASPKTVAVGATSGSRVADYTNYDSAIDFYADGDARVDPAHPDQLVNYGTSFATPRVATVLAGVHQKNPDWSNAQVEAFLRQKLSNQNLDWAGHSPAPNLSKEATQGYLLNQ